MLTPTRDSNNVSMKDVLHYGAVAFIVALAWHLRRLRDLEASRPTILSP